MSSLFRRFFPLLCLITCICHAQGTVRICADPDNLPFSSREKAGFDNRVAELLVRKMGKDPVFVWTRARRGFLRERFNHGDCDLLMGLPEGVKHVRETIPYYLSSYLFVTRKRENLKLSSFSDPAIGSQRIGLQILEEDFSPPSLPLIRYGHASQLVGFESFGAHAGGIIHAVATRQVGMAVVWGPVAGYYASRERTGLLLTPVQPAIEAGIPFRYAMTVAVHPNDAALAETLDRIIRNEHQQIHRILHSYHVPEVEKRDGAL
jgi:mxaJ protein